MGNSALVAKRLAQIPADGSKVAVFVARDGIRALVNIGSTSVKLPFVGLYLPPTGHPVQLELRGGEWVVTGPAVPLPGEGVITATGTPRAEVTAWGVIYSLRFKSSYTPVLSDLVALTWSADEGIIEGKLSASSSLIAPGTNPGSGASGTFHPKPFLATGSGSYRASNGWWTADVYASATNDGAFWYGTKIKDTIPDSATIVSARIYLPIRAINVNAPGQMRLHTNLSKPAGAPSFSGSAVDRPAVSGWHSVPLSWIDHLKANNGGVGFDGGGYWIIKAISSDRQSGALDISYRN